jgi:hypothetical protein
MVRGERSCFQLTKLIDGLDFTSKGDKSGGFSSPGAGAILRKEIQTFFWREQVDRKIAGNRIATAVVAPPANKRRRIKGSAGGAVATSSVSAPAVESGRREVGMDDDDESSEMS